MERTTLYLESSLKRRLREAASVRRTTEASIVREALEAWLQGHPRPKVRPVGRSRDGGVAHRVDEALEELGFGRR
jgi:hypothetical protein